MKWDDVAVFLAVAETGSLSGAAQRLGVDHSTVYRRLKQLTSSLGVPLFHRDGGRYRPSEAGAAALPYARAAQEAMAALQRSVTGHDQALAGPVRLTAPESLLPLLAPLVATFRRAHPAIELHLDLTDRFLALGELQADVAVRPTLRPPEGLHGRRVSAIAWAVYTPAGASPGASPWAAYGHDLAHLAAARWWEHHHRGTPRHLSVNSVPAMAQVVAQAGYRGLLPCFLGDADPRVERHGPPVDEAASALWLLVHPDLRRAARVRALLDHLWEGLKAHAPLLEGSGLL